MSEYAPRCPFCANMLKLERTFWEKLGLRSNTAQCPSCHLKCDPKDAHTMGSAYGHWGEEFQRELAFQCDALPVLSEAATMRALGHPHKDATQLVPSFKDLVRTCMKHHRAVLIEMARGREATLEAVQVSGQDRPAVVAVVGTTSPESGAKEQEQLIARIGTHQYILMNYNSAGGAEPRVKQAIHGKSPRSLTDAHVAAMHAEPHAGGRRT